MLSLCKRVTAPSLTVLFAFARVYGAVQASAPMTGEQDHQNMIDRLYITSLRPGADGFNA